MVLVAQDTPPNYLIFSEDDLTRQPDDGKDFDFIAFAKRMLSSQEYISTIVHRIRTNSMDPKIEGMFLKVVFDNSVRAPEPVPAGQAQLGTVSVEGMGEMHIDDYIKHLDRVRETAVEVQQALRDQEQIREKPKETRSKKPVH